jgi:hypothetical protein
MRSIESPSAAESLELIRAGLADLATSDIEGHGAAGLGAECAEILRLVGGLQRQAARRLARFEALGGPAGDDASSLSAWLGHRCRLRPWEATRLATTASRLHLLGETLTAFDGGAIEFGDVATIAEGVDRAAKTMSEGWSAEQIAEEAQPILLEAAGEVTPGQLRKAASRVALILDGVGCERRRRQIERQSFLDLGQTIDGVGSLRADMAASNFAVLEKAIDTFAPRPDPGAAPWRNLAGHRRLQGLVTACEIALSAASRHGYRERGGAPVTVHIVATRPTIDPAIPAKDTAPGRTEFGTIISAAQIRDMMRRRRPRVMTVHVQDDGRVTDRFTADGRPLNWGRTRRLFTSAQRDVYLALYAGCAAEGCDRPIAWSAIDHKQEWIAGGRTDLDNGQPLCTWHNLHKEHRRSDPRQEPETREAPETREDRRTRHDRPPAAGP